MSEKKILIVDYETKSLDYLSQLFDAYEFQIIKATDGLSAYDIYKSKKPDLIILEAMLPKMHGFDLTKKISQETNGKLPIIIVTGLYRGPQYKNEALNFLGASDYFEKPIDEKRLVDVVLSYLEVNVEIKEKLPDPDSVLDFLSKRIKNRSDESNKKKMNKVIADTGRSLDSNTFDESWDDALSDLDDDVSDKLSYLLQKKSKTVQKEKKSSVD